MPGGAERRWATAVCCAAAGLLALAWTPTAGAAPPPLPINFTQKAQVSILSENVLVDSFSAQLVGSGQDEWYSLSVLTSVGDSSVGRHAVLTRGDKHTMYEIIGPPGQDQICLVYTWPSNVHPPKPQSQQLPFLSEAYNATYRGAAAIRYEGKLSTTGVTMFYDAATKLPVSEYQTNMGSNTEIYDFDRKAPSMDVFAIPQLCTSNAVVLESEEMVKTSARATRFGRMRPHYVNALKREFERTYRPQWFKPSLSLADVPSSLDRRLNGSVAPVRNQGVCGSCWAFSSAATMETVLSVATGKPAAHIAVQGVIDCTPLGSESKLNLNLKTCRGCGGGWPALAFQNAINGTGIVNEDMYPNLGIESSCRKSAFPKGSTQIIKSYAMIEPGNEDAIIAAVAEHGAVTVIIDVPTSLEFYSGGIFDDPQCGTKPAHAVTVVGYDEESYIIKNSWGTEWGEAGFFRMVRGKNMCGIANMAAVPMA